MLLTGKDRDVGEVLVKSLQNTKYSINEKLENSVINLFSQKPKVSLEALPDAHTNKDVDQNDKKEALDDNKMDLDASESSDQDEDDAMTDSEASGSDDHDDDGAPGSKSMNSEHLQEQIEFYDGRRRRRAIFGDDVDQSDLMVSFMESSHIHITSKTRLCYGHSL